MTLTTNNTTNSNSSNNNNNNNNLRDDFHDSSSSSSSSWSLRRHITRISLGQTKWMDLESLFGSDYSSSSSSSSSHRYSSLHTLNIHQLGLPPLVSQMRQPLLPRSQSQSLPLPHSSSSSSAAADLPISFPRSITNLTLRVDGGFQGTVTPQQQHEQEQQEQQQHQQQQQSHEISTTFLPSSSSSSSSSSLQYLLTILQHCLSSSLCEFELNLLNYENPKTIPLHGHIWTIDPTDLPCSRTRIDWTPLCSFQQLHTFRYWRSPRTKLDKYTRPLPAVETRGSGGDKVTSTDDAMASTDDSTRSRLLFCCGQLPLLTSLYLYAHQQECLIDEIALLIQPQLRICRLTPFHWTREVLELLYQVQPHIEEFEDLKDSSSSSDHPDMDVTTIVRLFHQTKRISFSSSPNTMKEDEIVSALTQAKSLIRLDLDGRWFPQSIDSYIRLGQSSCLTNLTHLDLQQFDPLQLICQGRELGSQPLIDRFMRIDLRDSGTLLNCDTLRIFGHFISLTHLYTESCPVDTLDSFSSIYDILNDSTYLPRLQFMHVDCVANNAHLFLRYDFMEGINWCDYIDDVEGEAILIKKRIREQHNPIVMAAQSTQTTPPQSRLVGVELNPGPSSSSSSSSMQSPSLAMMHPLQQYS